MAIGVEGVLWYLVLLDSIGANFMVWFFSKWYKKNMSKGFVRHFPASKGWCLVYLVLVLWIGFGIYRLGLLGF